MRSKKARDAPAGFLFRRLWSETPLIQIRVFSHKEPSVFIEKIKISFGILKLPPVFDVYRRFV